jgi:hypothetical protein
MNKYRVYCETDGWVEVIASTEPTMCPNLLCVLLIMDIH